MNKSIKIALLFSLVFTTISNAQSKWGKEVWDAYMNSCVESSQETFGKEKATAYCGCTGVKLEIIYPDANELSSLGEEEIMEIAIYNANRNSEVNKAWEQFSNDLEKIQEETDGR